MVLAAGSWYASFNFWTIFLTAAGVVAAIIFGTLALIPQWPWRRQLTYAAVARSLLTEPATALQDSNITVAYDGSPISTPYLVALSVLSRSRRDIREEDFDGGRPLKFDLGVPIVARLAATEPNENATDDNLFQIGESTVSISPTLIRPGQIIRLNILTHAPPTPRIDLLKSNPLSGGIKVMEERDVPQRHKLRRVALVAAVVVLVLASILTTGLLVHSHVSPGASGRVSANPLPSIALMNAQDAGKAPQLSSTPSVLTNPMSAGISSVAYSPNDQYVAAGDIRGDFCVWSVTSGKPITQPIFDHKSASLGIYAVAFSPDGAYFATGDGNGDVYIWSPSFTLMRVLTDAQHDGSIRSIAFSENSKYLAAGDASGHTYVWSTTQFDTPNVPDKLNIMLDKGSYGVDAVAFDASNNELVSGDGNGNVYFWGKNILKNTIPYPQGGGTRAVAFGEGNYLAVGNADSSSSVYSTVTKGTNGDTVTYRLISRKMVSQSSGVNALTLSPDGQYLAVGDANGRVYLWSSALSASRQLILQSESSDFSETGAVTSVAFSSNGRHLAAGSSIGQLYQWTGQF